MITDPAETISPARLLASPGGSFIHQDILLGKQDSSIAVDFQSIEWIGAKKN
jgi:hypothetical protein